MRLRPLAVAIFTTLALGSTAQATPASLGFSWGNTYGAQFTAAGFYQNHAASFDQFDLLLPLAQTPASLLFLDARTTDRQGSAFEGNVGLGYRQLTGDLQQLWGVYGFYDRKRSADRNYYNQATVGGEYKTTSWVGDANAYVPFGRKVYGDHSFDAATLVAGNNPYGFSNIAFHGGQEKAMTGADAEVGYQFQQMPGLTAYVGGYYFDAPEVPNVSGPRARLTYQLPGLFGVKNEAFDHVTLEALAQHDDPRGTQWAAGAKFMLRFGGKSSTQLTAMQQRMLDTVQRDFDIVTGGNTRQGNRLLTNADGSPVTVQLAHDATSLANGIDNNANVVAVNGTIDNLTSQILHDGQTLTGGNYFFNHGQRIQLSTGGTLSAATGQGQSDDFIQVAKNNTIRDLSVNNVGGNGVAITNEAQGVGNLLIDNVMSQGSIYICVKDGSQDSNIQLVNNHINIGAAQGTNTGLTIIALRDSVINATVRNNTIELAEGVANPTGVKNSAAEGGIINYVGGFIGNHITVGDMNATDAISDAGVYNSSSDTGSQINFEGGFNQNTIIVGDIINNYFTAGAGVYNLAANSGTLSFAGGFNDNTVKTNNISNFIIFGGAGIYNHATNAGNLSFAGGLNHNTVTTGDITNSSSSGAAGIYNLAADGGTLSFAGGFNDNTVGVDKIINNNIAGGAGIYNYATNAGNLSFAGGFNHNTVTTGDITNSGSNGGAGIYNLAANADLSFAGGFNDNTVTVGQIHNTATSGGAGIYNYAYDNNSCISFNGFTGNQVQAIVGPQYVFKNNAGVLNVQIVQNGSTSANVTDFITANNNPSTVDLLGAITFYK